MFSEASKIAPHEGSFYKMILDIYFQYMINEYRPESIPIPVVDPNKTDFLV